MNMNSVDRIEEYSTLPSEKYLTDLTPSESDEDDQVKKAGINDDNSIFPVSYQAMDIESGVEGVEMRSTSAAPTRGVWPSVGSVTFEHIYLSYKPNAAPVLRYESCIFCV